MTFKPGKSGNPNGRPRKGLTLTDLISRGLAAKGEDGRAHRVVIRDKILELAEAGSLSAIRMILDRTEGKVPEVQEHTGAEGGPIIFQWQIGETEDDHSNA